MYKLSICFGAFLLALQAIAKTEAYACERKEKQKALLDLAKESINIAKDLHPACDNDFNNNSTNSSECGTKEKVSAYLDIAKKLIEEARANFSDYSICDVTEVIVEVIRHKRPVDCSEILENGRGKSGVYRIWPRHRIIEERSVQVYCDMDTDGGGWTVIQRRTDTTNKTDFYRDWKAYKEGFGNVREEFWLGNDIIFALTNQREYSLRFDMQNATEESRYATYFPFWIEEESAGYKLHIGNYNGTAGDGIRDANGMKFSTKDKRNDVADFVCTAQKRGGWWYKDCSRSNPNGVNHPGGKDDPKYVNWYPWTNYDPLMAIEMKIRGIKF